MRVSTRTYWTKRLTTARWQSRTTPRQLSRPVTAVKTLRRVSARAGRRPERTARSAHDPPQVTKHDKRAQEGRLRGGLLFWGGESRERQKTCWRDDCYETA